MNNRRHIPTNARRGIAYILAFIFLAAFSSLAVAYASFTNTSLQQSNNDRNIACARLAAESGLAYADYTVRSMPSPSSWSGTPDMVDAVYVHLSGMLDGSPNLASATVTKVGSTVFVPSISMPNGTGSFSFTVSLADSNTMKLTVIGAHQTISRKLELSYQIVQDESVLDYAVASSSRVMVTDEAVIDGDVYSTWDRHNISGYDIPPVLMEDGTEVIGRVKTIMGDDDFTCYDFDDYLDGEYQGLDYNEPKLTEYTTDDFDTSCYKSGTVDITTVATPDEWLDNDPFPNASNIRRRIDRPVYINQVFDNIHIPVGHNPKFIGCTFNSITYVDTNETTTLDQWSHGYYDEHAIPGQESRSDDRENEHSNNVLFDGCSFNGPVITAVPRDYWWSKNALTFEGTTVFENTFMPQSTILAPNFGVDIGGRGYDSESNPDSKLTGAIIGGIVDIRGTANIEGTILSIYYPDTDRGSAARYYGTNVGFCDDGGETGGATGFPGSIRIAPQQTSLPAGVRPKYTLSPVSNTYAELTQ